MGFRRRTRRRALVAGAMMEHHHDKVQAQDQDAGPAPAGYDQGPAQYAPPPADPASQLEHLAQLHASGALTDEEFATAKAQALGT